ncbi:hypothetical protein FAD93_002379 [Enterococcus faecalis]|uniref:hypothetical protein n=1 Tax=Enterococcus faecalis TaxID=1351 RepID=UPI0019E1E1DC|nr:hypothetical protein [Enterococcus faecalis]EGO8121907.1 hypothetical protein [Enterococcus faecalis]MBO1083363.1 hypothetical protein [Enterococcus faecalis]
MRTREFSFMYKPKYKEIIQSLQEGIKQVERLNEYDSKEERIRETTSSIVEQAKQKLDDFVKTERNQLANQKKAIEKSYIQSRNVYENPTEELLRRQDFDMEISAMSESEIMDFLKTEGRQFTAYELNKIHSLNVKNEEIKITVKQAIKENRYPYLNDLKYQRLTQEENELALIENKPLQQAMLYLPSNNAQGYKTLSIKSLFMSVDKQELKQKKAMIEESLFIKPSISVETFTTGLATNQLKKIEENTQMKYKDFDSRAIRGSEAFNISDRFDYLKERFDDKHTNRFDPIKENYDIGAHLDFLEGEHTKKMQQDENYRKAYEEAEQSLNKENSSNDES